MKFCRHCGNEIMDESVICPKCGCATGAAPEQKETASTGGSSGLVTAAKILMIVGTVITGCTGFLIPLAWCIPMTVSYFGKVKRGEPVGTGFKVCSLLFVSMLGGIFMLCSNESAARPATIPADAVPTYSSDGETMSYAVEGAPASGAGKAFSIVSLVTGIVGLLLSCCCGGFFGSIPAIAAIVFSILSKVKSEKFNGMAIAGLVLGIAAIVSLVFAIIFNALSGGSSIMSEMINATGDVYF